MPNRNQHGGENTPLPHDCDKGPLMQMMLQREESIFNKLDEISVTLRDVAVQKNEIEHLNDRVDEIDVKVDRLQVSFNKIIDGDYERRKVAAEEELKKLLVAHNPEEKSTGPVIEKPLASRIALTAMLTCVSVLSAGATAFFLYLIYDNIQGFVNFQKTQLTPPAIEHKR